MSKHEITVEYTCDDDGIHLYCSCGWKSCLGYCPSPEAVIMVADQHRKAMETKEESKEG